MKANVWWKDRERGRSEHPHRRKGISFIVLFHYTTEYDRKHIMSVQNFARKKPKNNSHNHHPSRKRIYENIARKEKVLSLLKYIKREMRREWDGV